MKSKCQSPRARPLVWIDIFEENHQSVQELLTYLASLNPLQRDELIARIIALRIRAAAGKLSSHYQDFENISRYPGMFELKWANSDSKGVTHIRQYHFEPFELPMYLVALHIHIKWLAGTNTEIRSKQNTELDQANHRLGWARNLNWSVQQYNL